MIRTVYFKNESQAGGIYHRNARNTDHKKI